MSINMRMHAQCRRQLSVVAAPSVIGLADLLGVAQHRSDQVGSLSTFGMSDVTVIVKTLPDEIPSCLFGLTLQCLPYVFLKAQSQSHPSPTH